MAVPAEQQHIDLEDAEDRALERMFKRIEAKRAGVAPEPDAFERALQAEKEAEAAAQVGLLHSARIALDRAVDSAHQLWARVTGRERV